jgi:hypothetical protein
MEDAPPNYQLSNTRDHWSIIARYIHSEDLCSAALVSKRWHELVVPRLWGNPASHFGTEDDSVYGEIITSTNINSHLKGRISC